ncbi:hypothetical protein PV516_19400 [Streptomyces scabiei]|uniref:hypothetical protein n=1 Tax=Streptomyces scabiei TaxID=1930 RepID=UPI0029B4C520|nr:hypothetical protein [Streptomyces scabiei]MDX3165956.1 hypothetical protein [Streptomyces scabiei]
MSTPHHLTIADTPDGRSTDWTHPVDCAEGEHCDIFRRTHRMGMEEMSALGDGREPGRYLLGRFGFHGLLLVDENGGALPDVVEVLSPAAQAARQIAAYVITELAEGICEDTDRLVELAEVIRRGQTLDQWEGAANEAIDTIIDEHLGTMRAFAAPIERLLGGAA